MSTTNVPNKEKFKRSQRLQQRHKKIIKDNTMHKNSMTWSYSQAGNIIQASRSLRIHLTCHQYNILIIILLCKSQLFNVRNM